ncbi:MAG TPA: hypothetical protein VE567_02345, partial [Sphingomonas sp.]|nr:hypothetical protein [Sphingomonas sp.]
VGALVHKAILATLILLLVLGLVVLVVMRKPLRPALLGGLAIAVAILGHLSVNVAIERISGHAPLDPPFLLARMVGDGTVPSYLDRTCPAQHFYLCRYRDRLPLTENDFLWGRDPQKSVFATASLDDKRRILAEANTIVRGAILTDPWGQLSRTAGNMARQFFVAGIEEYGVLPINAATDNSGMRQTLLTYVRDSGIAERTMPLRSFSMATQIPYLLGLAVLAILLIGGRDRLEPSLRLLILFLIAGVVLNAAVCGGLAGVFDRYQGRVAWLIPLIAMCALILWRRAQARMSAPSDITTTAPAAP